MSGRIGHLVSLHLYKICKTCSYSLIVGNVLSYYTVVSHCPGTVSGSRSSRSQWHHLPRTFRSPIVHLSHIDYTYAQRPEYFGQQ